MSFIKPTTNSSPFATSTAWANIAGASAYNQSWISVFTTPQNNTTATLDSGEAISMTSGQNTTNVSRYYYDNHNDYALSGHLYYTSGQSLSESSDEIICVDNAFTIYGADQMDSTVSRTHIIKVEP